MSWFIRREPKRFSYKPRFYHTGESPYEIKHRFDAHRTAKEPAKGLKAKLQKALREPFFGGERVIRLRLMIILAVLLLIALYIIDFDLRIFMRKP